jgi:hypothetical protein
VEENVFINGIFWHFWVKNGIEMLKTLCDLSNTHNDFWSTLFIRNALS